MAINKKLIHFDKKETFKGANGINNATSADANGYWGNIPNTSIVFIKDTQEIWTHGQYYSMRFGTASNAGLPLTLGENSVNVPIVSRLADDANLNNCTTPGFYNAGGSNSVTNKPSVDAFGLLVIHDAAGDYYTQMLFDGNASDKVYMRHCNIGTWTSWSELKFTDTDTKTNVFLATGPSISLKSKNSSTTCDNPFLNTYQDTNKSNSIKFHGDTLLTITGKDLKSTSYQDLYFYNSATKDEALVTSTINSICVWDT